MVKKIEGADVAPVAPASAETALAELERQANDNATAGERAQEKTQEKAEKAQADELEQDLLAALRMVQTLARRAVWWLTEKEFDALWGDSTLKGIAAPGAEIMRRHGITFAGLMEKYGPYLALGGAVALPALATVAAYKQATRTPRETVQPAAEEVKS